MFCDLAGFTTIAERAGGAGAVSTLNLVMGAMTDEVIATGGYVNKFLGDGLMAFWSAFELQPDQAERAARQAHLQQAESDFEPIPFDAAAARAFGRVAASLRRNNRKTAARAYDAMIAAVALSRGLPVYTCNPADFAAIDGLEVMPVDVP
ncbi:MAG: PIN domain-containing protein [Gammaproteobacteria bacterium]|nr:PIN domain-containing protein [Gammaproteobacteria bacterium]